MNGQHLLTILLVGMLLSACAQFDPYRTQTKAEEWPPKCGVDGNALAKDPNKLCENPAFAAHAIQHRYYTGSYKYKDDEGINQQDKLDKGNYYLSFVEFDDQGWFAKRKQMEVLFALLKDLKDQNREALIYVYAHGWKHNASSCDNNVVCFSRLLERTDLMEQKILGSKRTVVGVYLGWRGLPFDSVLNNLSFWTRKDTAARVGRGGVFELLTRLKDYRDSRQGGKTDLDKTQLIVTGHSFGGLVIYSALSHALMAGAVKTTNNPDGAIQYDVAESFGDFVMLVNPAFEGSMYEPLFHIATNRCYDEREKPKREKQRPVMMIVTSEADSATGKAFPIGRTLGTLFQHAMTDDQKQSMRTAIGHDRRYQTHDLKAEKTIAEADKPVDTSDCGCPYLEATLEWDQQSLLKRFRGVVDRTFGSNQYGEGISLEPVRNKKEKTDPPHDSSQRYASRYPYLVVKTDGRVIADHNAIYNERFITFAQLFFIDHIAKNNPLPGDEHKQQCWDEEALPDCTAGGLLSCKQSCLDDKGKSCSVLTQ